MAPTHLPRMAHCLARCCCQNPKTSSESERPINQGRRVMKKALAASTPRAPANPSGRQQLIVAKELRIAPKDAEIPVPCLIATFLRGLQSLRGEPVCQEDGQSSAILNANGRSIRRRSPLLVLLLHP